MTTCHYSKLILKVKDINTHKECTQTLVQAIIEQTMHIKFVLEKKDIKKNKTVKL